MCAFVNVSVYVNVLLTYFIVCHGCQTFPVQYTYDYKCVCVCVCLLYVVSVYLYKCYVCLFRCVCIRFSIIFCFFAVLVLPHDKDLQSLKEYVCIRMCMCYYLCFEMLFRCIFVVFVSFFIRFARFCLKPQFLRLVA